MSSLGQTAASKPVGSSRINSATSVTLATSASGRYGVHRVGGQAGFTLLEVMVALGILAAVMAAITSAQGSSLLYGARVFNLTTATQLADEIILDIEEEYRLDGFPDNSKEGEDCDLPRGFDRFDCEYDLLAVDIGSDNMMSATEKSSSVLESPMVAQLCSGGASGQDADINALVSGAVSGPGGMGALEALVNPAYAQLCGMNLQKMCANIPMIEGFIPMIIEAASKTTRKLVVRISWDERGNARKTVELETFITATPKAEDANL